MPHPQVTIIIPALNKWELTAHCLQSIKDHTQKGLYHVTVVDNGSTDATTTELPILGKQLFGKAFTRIRYEENNNFAPACNAGAKAATTPFILLLNNDTLVHPNWLPPLLQAFEKNNNLGAVGPLLTYANNTVQHLGVTFSCRHAAHLYKNFPSNHPIVKKQRRIQALTGAALLMPIALYWQCGGLFEGYRNGCEDIELSLQLGKLGKRLMCIPQSVVTHLESQTPGRFDFDKENFTLLQLRHKTLFTPDLHHHALRDGFAIVLDDTYEICLTETAEKSAELLAKTKNKPVKTLLAALEEHPLWLEGKVLLASTLQENKLYSDAVFAWEQAIATVPCKQYYKNMLTCAVNSKDAELIQSVQKQYESFTKVITPEVTTKNVHYALQLAQKFNDKYLHNLYSNIQKECIGNHK